MEEQLRRAVETAPRDRLPMVAGLVWRALSEGAVTELQAEALSLLIEARKSPAAVAPVVLRTRQGSRPRTSESMVRRRRWAASGRLPPGLACQFTQGEVAVMSVVARQVVKTGDCRLPLDHIAAIAGVSRSTVRNAMKQARLVGAVTVEERRLSRWRNAPNVVRIVSAAWVSWLRMGRLEDHREGGRKSVSRTTTEDSRSPLEGSQKRTAEGFSREGRTELKSQRLAHPHTPSRAR